VELLFVVVVVLVRLRIGLFKGLSFSTKPSNVTFLLPSLVFNTGEEAAEAEDNAPVLRTPVVLLLLLFLLSFHCCKRTNRL
jgi:predicted permease